MNNPVEGIAGRVALVTGASSGLGAHFAQVLARAGAIVVVAARRRDKLETVSASIRDDGGQVMAVTMDVTNEDSVAQALQTVHEQLGTIGILINNAGMAESKTFHKLDEDKWRRTLTVNLDGAWRVAHQVTRHLIAEGQAGVVVNIASILGLRVGFGHSAYAVSKAGLIQLTRSMALELGPRGIRVNALCPGYIATDINADYFATPEGADYIRSTPAGRTGRLTELDGPLLLLCSDAGSFINGIALPVDGGHLVSSL
ncbi:SDR family NAD(P)-dependent oxidoreductase [Granulosicoccus sp. 3-233]|uniref:SDR family NAD(P)-dependent oxidoreductase n=1 Tax=Granulosicoccus sp. 3-233 TaxID=3417969 RepID=UPI003D3551CF